MVGAFKFEVDGEVVLNDYDTDSDADDWKVFSTAKSDAYNRSLGDESNFETEEAAFHNKSSFLI